MNIEQIFLTQLIISLVVISLLAKWYATPFFAEKPLQLALTVLLIPHAFRHIGMTFLIPVLNQPSMPTDFATAAAYGDLL